MSDNTNNIANLSQEQKRVLLSQILQEKAQKSNEALQVKCLHQLFEAQVERTPNAVAVVFEKQQLSYQELNSRANQLANYLRSFDVGPEVIVGICMEHSLELVVALLGILKAGGAYVPLDPAYPKNRLNLILKDSQISLLLSQKHLLERLPEPKAEIISIETIAQQSQQNPMTEVMPENLAYVLYSSSRGVLVEHCGVSHRLNWLQKTFALSESDVILCQAPLAQDGGVFEIFWTLAFGGRLVIAAANQNNPTYLQHLIATQKVSLIHFVPTALSAFIQSLKPDSATQLNSLRLVFCSGEPLRQSVAESFSSHLTGKLYNLYSQPEAVGEVTSQACWQVNTQDPLPVGYPTHRYVHILNQRLRPVLVGIKGEIYVGGRDLARGYLGNPVQTAERFIKNPFSEVSDTRLFKTGLLGRYRNDGALELVGSVNRLVWIQGFIVELEEVEAALLASSSVEDCRVLARETETSGFQLVAYVVLSGSFALKSLQSHIQSLLPSHMLPYGYVQLNNIPLTATGQVDEQALAGLEVIDSDLVARWEQQLQSLPEIEQIAVLVQEKAESLPPLHLSDLLPNWKAVFKENVSQFVPPSHFNGINKDVGLKKKLAISHGEILRLEEGNPTTLTQALQRAALQMPTKGITYIQVDGSEITQSYKNLLEEAQRISAGLRKLGLKPQDKVIFHFDLNQDFIPAFWGCILGGFVPVPLSVSSNYEVSKLQNVWQMLDKAIVLTTTKLAHKLRSMPELLKLEDFQVETVDNLRECDADPYWQLTQPDDVALLVLTSGSTGRPKGVVLSHNNLLSRTAGSIQMNNFSSQAITLNWMPLEHVAGIIYFHIRDVYLGCQQIHAPTEIVLQNPLKWLDWIDYYRVTITFAPNFAYGLINNHVKAIGKKRWDLSSIQFILNGAEAIVAKTARQFLELLTPHGLPARAIYPAWGMAEVSSGVTYSKNFSLDSTGDDSFVEVGVPIPGVSLRIVNTQNQIVEEDTLGELQVSGLTVTSGYYQNPELNQEVFTDDCWFKTGDLGFLHQGRLTIVGRDKDVIIINGINYYSHEIEAVVEELDGVEVSYTAAVGVRDTSADTDKLVIFFCPVLSDEANVVKLTQEIRSKVVQIGVNPSYLVPLEKQTIPKTALGKIQRSQLKKRFESDEFNDILKRLDLVAENANTLPNWFYRKIWCQKQAIPNAFFSKTGKVLVFLDQLGLGTFLCEQLEQHNLPCVSIESGLDFAQLSPNRYCMTPKNPNHYRRLLESLAADNIEINQILHLWTYDNYVGEACSLAALEEAQEQGVYSLLLLVQALAKFQRSKHTVRLLFISSYTQGTSPTDEIAYQKSPVLGIIKTISQELPWIMSRHVDLSRDQVEVNGVRILQELRVLSKEREVVYRNGKRLVPRLEKVDLSQLEKQELPFKQGGIYLVSGGLGGIGIEIAKYLLKHYQARLLLVGRTSLPERSTWQAYTQQKTDKISLRIQAYLALEQLEGEVIYESVDICNLARLQQVVEQAKCRWGGKLDGVIHLAGTVHERMLIEETQESLAEVLRPKILGTWVLHQLLKDQTQGIFINFSSVNGFFGGTTVGAYAAANSFLDSFAHYQKYHSPLQSYCFAWSMWDEMGVSQGFQMKELTRARGYHVLNASQGLYSLLAGLHHDQTQFLVGLDGSNRNLRQYINIGFHTIHKLTAYFTTNNKGSSVARLPELMVRDRFQTKSICDFVQLEEMPLTDSGEIARERLVTGTTHQISQEWVAAQNEVARLMANIWQEVLGIPQIGIHDNFFELGGDSILSIQVVARANLAGLQIIPKQLFQHQTIAELVTVVGKNQQMVVAQQGIVSGLVPLTPIQHWFFEQNLPEPHHFNQSVMLVVAPDLKPSLLQPVLQQLLVHHDALRLRFESTDSGWQQNNASDDQAVDLSLVDLSEVASNEQPAALERIAALHQASLNLAQGLLMRGVLFQFGANQPGRLLLVVHHLVVDGVSWRILLEDLANAYQQLDRGRKVQLPPKTTAFADWAQRLFSLGQSVAVTGELDYWLGQMSSPVAALPVDYVEGKQANTVASQDVVSVSLSVQQTRALLQEVPSVYNTQINDVLLTALVQSFAQWTGERVQLIDLEGHGREELFADVDTSRTVGWFTSIFPIRLELGEVDEPGAALKSVKEQLRRLPKQGIGYGLLRYLNSEQATRSGLLALPKAEVSFNYLGQFDRVASKFPVLGFADEPTGANQSPLGHRSHLLSVNCFVASSKLQMNWTYSQNVHQRLTVERLAFGLIEALSSIIAHCQSPDAGGFTPSDFSEVELSQEDLDELVAKIN